MQTRQTSASNAPAGTHPRSLMCQQTQKLFDHPMVAGDDWSYEHAAIQALLKRRGSYSPRTHGPMPQRPLLPNRQLKTAVEEYKYSLALPAHAPHRDAWQDVQNCPYHRDTMKRPVRLSDGSVCDLESALQVLALYSRSPFTGQAFKIPEVLRPDRSLQALCAELGGFSIAQFPYPRQALTVYPAPKALEDALGTLRTLETALDAAEEAILTAHETVRVYQWSDLLQSGRTAMVQFIDTVNQLPPEYTQRPWLAACRPLQTKLLQRQEAMMNLARDGFSAALLAGIVVNAVGSAQGWWGRLPAGAQLATTATALLWAPNLAMRHMRRADWPQAESSVWRNRLAASLMGAWLAVQLLALATPGRCHGQSGLPNAAFSAAFLAGGVLGLGTKRFRDSGSNQVKSRLSTEVH